MFDKEPCLTCYAEDCLHRKSIGEEEMSSEEFASIFPAPYICNIAGYSICEGHAPYALIAGWKPRLKTDIEASLSKNDKTPPNQNVL